MRSKLDLAPFETPQEARPNIVATQPAFSKPASVSDTGGSPRRVSQGGDKTACDDRALADVSQTSLRAAIRLM